MTDQSIEHLRQPPSSLVAEQSLLGAVMANPILFDETSGIISADDLFFSAHKPVWRAITELASENSEIDVITVAEKLGEDCDITFLANLVSNNTSNSNAKSYARLIRDKAKERALLLAAGAIVDEVYNSDAKTSDKIDSAQARLMALTPLSSNGPRPLNSVLKAVVDEVDMRFQRAGELNGLGTGFIDLDKRFNGLRPTDLIVLAGRPGCGKTTMAMNIAAQNAIRESKPVLVFSLEMSSEQLSERMIASLGGISFDRIRKGDLHDDDWPKLTSAISLIKDKPLILDDRGGMTLNQIRSTARTMKRQHDIRLIIVDYLQLISHKADNRDRSVAEISASLKNLAKELKVPVIALSQLSRGVENRSDRRPQMSDLRDSGAIEQDADIIIFVYRDELYDVNTEHKGVAEIITRKFRNGEVGTDFLLSRLDLCQFRNTLKPVEPLKQKPTSFDY